MRTWLWDLMVLLGVSLFLMILPIFLLNWLFDWPRVADPPNLYAIVLCTGVALIVIGLVGRKLLIQTKPKSSN